MSFGAYDCGNENGNENENENEIYIFAPLFHPIADFD